MAKKIVILGGGFGGANLAVELERLLTKRSDVEVTLVSRDNFYVMTPLLFEAVSGALEARHVVNPIRPLLQKTRFLRAEITGVDLVRRVVSARSSGGEVEHTIPYDEIVVALGGVPRSAFAPGSEHALPFKTIEDAVALRTHIVDAFERASVEEDRARREQLLRFIVIGGGLVGVELAGELSHFLESLRKTYNTIRRDEISLHVLEASPKLAADLDPTLASYIEKTFAQRGIQVRTRSAVIGIGPEELYLRGGELIRASTIVLAAGLAVNPLVASLPVEHDEKGRIVTDATMRSVSHREVWALGDIAAIPFAGQPGKTYPPLAQHAHREAKLLARNIVSVADGKMPAPLVVQTLGTAALIGDGRAVVQLMGLRLHGFGAWWLWRTLALLRVPRWDRRLHLMMDWTTALLFPADSAQLRVAGQGDGARARPSKAAPRVTAAA